MRAREHEQSLSLLFYGRLLLFAPVVVEAAEAVTSLQMCQLELNGAVERNETLTVVVVDLGLLRLLRLLLLEDAHGHGGAGGDQAEEEKLEEC